MADGSEIKNRIESVSETKKVTDAMYLISSVKIRRAKREVEKTAPYFNALKKEIGDLIRHIPKTSNRYFRIPDPAAGQHTKRGILLVTSDKGLAGEYNHTALSVCEDYIKKHSETVVFIVGEYGRQYFESKGMEYVGNFRYSAEFPTVWKARKICADILEYYDARKLDDINIIYTNYIAGKAGQCKRSVLLPLTKSMFAAENNDNTQKSEFYPDPDTVLTGVIPSYLTGFIYSSLVDSYCCEQLARMTAMNSASQNAEKMLRELRMQYNRVRQAAITREITEVTAGARALAKKKNRPLSDTEE